MTSCSAYLSKPLRTLPQACREIAAAHPELPRKDCRSCANAKLCTFYDRIERSGLDQPTL